MASFRAWAAVGPFDGTLVSSTADGKGLEGLKDVTDRDRGFLERASLKRRVDDLEWRRSSMYTDPEQRRSAWKQPLHPLDSKVLSPRVVCPHREVSTTVTNSRGDVMNTHTIRDIYGDQVTSRCVADQYSVKTSVAHDPCAGDRAVSPLPVSLVLSPNHRDDFMLDQLRTKTYMDRLDGTDTRSLYLDDPLCSRSSRYLDDPVWRRSRYLDDPLWSSPSRILEKDLWRHPSTNKSSALNDRAWRRSMRALM